MCQGTALSVETPRHVATSHGPPGRGRAVRSALATVVLVVLPTLAVAACAPTAGYDGTDGDGARNGEAVIVSDMSFAPEVLTVPAGSTVTWIFDDGGLAHDVVFDDLDVASELLTEDTFSHTFEEPGTYTYQCSPHPSMTGAIEVTP